MAWYCESSHKTANAMLFFWIRTICQDFCHNSIGHMLTVRTIPQHWDFLFTCAPLWQQTPLQSFDMKPNAKLMLLIRFHASAVNSFLSISICTMSVTKPVAWITHNLMKNAFCQLSCHIHRVIVHNCKNLKSIKLTGPENIRQCIMVTGGYA